MAKNPLIRPKAFKPKLKRLNKSAGILDDYAVRKNINTQEGTIEHVPTDDNHIANKKYVDDNAGGFTDPMTTRGDLIYKDPSNDTTRLGVGAAGTFLGSDGTDVSWDTPAGSGDVSAAANISDNSIVRGDGGAKGVQESGWEISDGGNISIVTSYNGLLGSFIENTYAGAATVAGAITQLKNDNGYWGLIGMTNSGSTIGGGAFANTMHYYNQGYNDTLFTVDGNKDFVWYSDPTDQHDFTALTNQVMTLSADGDLTLDSGDFTGGNVTTGQNPGHTHTLDDLDNPAGNKTFVMGTNEIGFTWTNPTGDPMTLTATGGYTGSILKVVQSGGNPGSTYLLELESSDADVEHIKSTVPSAGIHSFCGYVSGDTSERLAIHGDGLIEWGPGGAAAQDTNLYRDSANQLKTDDALYVVGNITTDGTVDGIDVGTDVAANTAARHAESHTIVSHSDTSATGAELNTLTGGGDTTLHDHDGISENTAARHTQNTDTALGSGAVAADHGTAATDQIINVCYGTSATPPTASTTTEGALYVQYTA